MPINLLYKAILSHTILRAARHLFQENKKVDFLYCIIKKL